MSSLAPLTPPALDHVVQGCLAKAPADRWQTAHDVKMELQWIQAQGSRLERRSTGRGGPKTRRPGCRGSSRGMLHGARRDDAAAVITVRGDPDAAGPF